MNRSKVCTKNYKYFPGENHMSSKEALSKGIIKEQTRLIHIDPLDEFLCNLALRAYNRKKMNPIYDNGTLVIIR